MKYIDEQTRHSRQALNGSKQCSMLPEPNFNPKLPEKDTLEYRALILMLQGKKISHRDFDNITNSWRLAAYILKLKKLGWSIEDENVINFSLKQSKIRYIKKYFLSSGIIAKFYEMGGVL